MSPGNQSTRQNNNGQRNYFNNSSRGGTRNDNNNERTRFNGASVNLGLENSNTSESSNNENNDNNSVTKLHGIYEKEIATIKVTDTTTENRKMHKPDISVDIYVLLINADEDKLITELLDSGDGSNFVKNQLYKKRKIEKNSINIKGIYQTTVAK